MTKPLSPRVAPGGPGIEPRWSRGAKAAVGTAYSTSSHVWYTLDRGCVTEVYYPTIDSPQIRDLQLLSCCRRRPFPHTSRRSLPVALDGGRMATRDRYAFVGNSSGRRMR